MKPGTARPAPGMPPGCQASVGLQFAQCGLCLALLQLQEHAPQGLWPPPALPPHPSSKPPGAEAPHLGAVPHLHIQPLVRPRGAALALLVPLLPRLAHHVHGAKPQRCSAGRGGGGRVSDGLVSVPSPMAQARQQRRPRHPRTMPHGGPAPAGACCTARVAACAVLEGAGGPPHAPARRTVG